MSHDNGTGYHNVDIAKKFAEFIYDDMRTVYDKPEDKTVILLGLDGSSIYLSAHLKILCPNWGFVSAANKDDDFKYWHHHDKPETDCLIFVDDYFYKGKTVDKLIKLLLKRSESRFAKLGNNLRLYFIQSSHKLEKFRIDNKCILNVTARVMDENKTVNLRQLYTYSKW